MESSDKICCKECQRTPDEIAEYRMFARENDMTPTEYVIKEEGTYNPKTHKFLCTKCYIAAGMPRGKA